jgi:hypothetical protein
MILSICIALAALAFLFFGEKLWATYLAALESLGVSQHALDFLGKVFPILRWFFAPAALALAILSFFWK